MRLNELNIPDNVYDVSDLLRRGGWEIVGSGYHANIYGKADRDYIIKVFEGDPQYRRFLDLIRQNPNPHFPRILGRVVHQGNLVGLRIEKLTPTPKYLFVKGMEVSFSSLFTAYIREFNPNDILKDYIEPARAYLSERPALRRALDLIRELVRPTYNALDLHTGNIMMRGDVPVIIDPVS